MWKYQCIQDPLSLAAVPRCSFCSNSWMMNILLKNKQNNHQVMFKVTNFQKLSRWMYWAFISISHPITVLTVHKQTRWGEAKAAWLIQVYWKLKLRCYKKLEITSLLASVFLLNAFLISAPLANTWMQDSLTDSWCLSFWFFHKYLQLADTLNGT